MKKLVLVMVCTMLLAMFIAFNYLLWDRQNKMQDIKDLESSKASKNASINVLAKEVDRLEEENKKFIDSIKMIENGKKLMQEDNDELQKQNRQQTENITAKANTIDALLELTDTTSMQLLIKNWFEALESKNYKAAYTIFPRNFNNNLVESLDIFKKSWEQDFKDVKLKSIRLIQKDQKSEDEIGSIIFLVSFDTKLSETVDPTSLKIREGNNYKLIVIDYNSVNNIWFLKDILHSDIEK